MKQLFLLFLLLLPLSAEDLFTCDEDGAFDVSDYLGTRYGFLPVPAIITEPAVGYGAGLSLLFLHDTFYSAQQKKSPPSISGIIFGATENGTKVGGAFHLGFWQEDTIRTTTAVGAMDININLYVKDIGLNMNVSGYFAYQELMFRLGESDFFLGANYAYADLLSKSIHESNRPPLDFLLSNDFQLGGLAAIVQYDTRDSIFTPSKGLFAKATLRRFDEHLGGSVNFWRYGAKAFYFHSLTPQLILGLRVEGEAVAASSGDAIPYVMRPSIIMRGIASMRYQGEKTLTSELQLRYEFLSRWNIVAFGGVGKTFGKQQQREGLELIETTESFIDAPLHPAGGLGFRYELARKFGLWSGLDFATSQDQDLAIYITVGSAWGAF